MWDVLGTAFTSVGAGMHAEKQRRQTLKRQLATEFAEFMRTNPGATEWSNRCLDKR